MINDVILHFGNVSKYSSLVCKYHISLLAITVKKHSRYKFQLHAVSGELEIPESGMYTLRPSPCVHTLKEGLRLK